MDQPTESKLLSDVGEIKGTVESLAGTMKEHVKQGREDKRELWAALGDVKEQGTRNEGAINYLSKSVNSNEEDIKSVAGRSGGKLGAWAGTGMAGVVIGIVEYLKSVFTK